MGREFEQAEIAKEQAAKEVPASMVIPPMDQLVAEKSEVTIKWRGSVTDLVTDIAHELTKAQLCELAVEIQNKINQTRGY